MVNYKDRKIVYTFKYGARMFKDDKIILSILPAFGVVMMIVSLLLGYILDCKVDGWICFVLSGFLCIFLLSLTLHFWLRDIRSEKEILQWLTDEEIFEICAVPEEIEPKQTKTGYAYKYKISFEHNGTTYYKTTADYDHLRSIYQAVKFKKGEEISFLYSPKYGEVIVFENGQVKIQ